MSDQLERRAYTDCRIASDDGRRLKGYAIVFNSRSLDLGGFIEIVAPEAIDRTLKEATDVRALVDHDSGKVIGRTRAGTLTLSKDRKGMHVEIDPDPQISYANDVMRAVTRGDISGMSFGFRTLEDSWNYEGDTPLRTILDMEVREVSIVAMPAYPATNIDVAQRSLQEYQAKVRRSRVYLERWHKTQLAK